MPKDSPPAITLRDPVTQKTASLTDEQGVRSLLVLVIERLAATSAWEDRLPDDSTERVAAQILRKGGGLMKALAIVKESKTLHAILAETELAEDIKAIPKPKAGEKQVGLLGDDALKKLCEDVVEALTMLWPTFRDSIEKAEGLEPKKAVANISFVPETDDADAYVKVVAETRVSTKELNRTSKVRRLKSGRHQLELFAS